MVVVQRIATVLYVVLQAAAACCALIVLSADIQVSPFVRTVATIVVAFYVLSVTGTRLALACIVRNPFSKKTGVTQA